MGSPENANGDCRKMAEKKGGEVVGCFISATPGSFYGRLIPRNSVHFFNSSYSLHWHSQVPKGLVGEDGKEALNKGCVYGRKGCPPRVLQAYRNLFEQDFTLFLRSRSTEIVHGGRMLLTFGVTLDEEMSIGLESISRALYKFAQEGLIDKQKLDLFNLPFYRASIKQVMQLIDAEGSFVIHKWDTFGMPSEDADNINGAHDLVHLSMVSRRHATTMRVIFEPLLASEFGEEIMDDLFCSVEEMAMENLIETGGKIQYLDLVVSLIRKG